MFALVASLTLDFTSLLLPKLLSKASCSGYRGLILHLTSLITVALCFYSISIRQREQFYSCVVPYKRIAHLDMKNLYMNLNNSENQQNIQINRYLIITKQATKKSQ